MRIKTKNENDGRVLSARGPDGRLGIAVELYRDASGSNVARAPGSDWGEQMREVAKNNSGKVSVVMHTECSSGYDNQHGVAISIVPGMLSGKLGGHGENLRQPIEARELWHYGNAGGVGFSDKVLTIETNLGDAIQLHKALGKVIRNAKRLSAKAKLKKAAREEGRADDVNVKYLTSDIGGTVVIEGLDRDFLRGPMLRALERGELDAGHLLVVLSPGQSAGSIEIPWKLLVDIEMRWKTEQDLSGEFRIDGKTTVQGRIKANLVSGRTTITYDLPEVALAG